MEIATYLVTAVLVEGQSVRAVARDYGVSKTWLYELLARYEAEGEAGLVPRSKRPHSFADQIADLFEDEIVRIRKSSRQAGFDAGPETIEVHLARARRRARPVGLDDLAGAEARGFIVPEPHKRPRSSWIRFWPICPTSAGRWTSPTSPSRTGQRSRSSTSSTTTPASASPRWRGGSTRPSTWWRRSTRRPHSWGYPAVGALGQRAVFTAAARHGVCVMESELARARHRLQALAARAPPDVREGRALPPNAQEVPPGPAPPRTIAGLQAQLDAFVAYYNEVRPHRSLGRRTPLVAFSAPPGGPTQAQGCRRSAALSHPPGQGPQGDPALPLDAVPRRRRRAHEGRRVLILVANRDVRVLTSSGELIRHLRLDPGRLYQPLGLGNRP